VDTNRLHGQHTIRVLGSDLQRLGEELGLDVVSAVPLSGSALRQLR